MSKEYSLLREIAIRNIRERACFQLQNNLRAFLLTEAIEDIRQIVGVNSKLSRIVLLEELFHDKDSVCAFYKGGIILGNSACSEVIKRSRTIEEINTVFDINPHRYLTVTNSRLRANVLGSRISVILASEFYPALLKREQEIRELRVKKAIHDLLRTNPNHPILSNTPQEFQKYQNMRLIINK